MQPIMFQAKHPTNTEPALWKKTANELIVLRNMQFHLTE